MRASYVVGLAFVLMVVGRWAHNKPAISFQGALAMAFALVVISVLDQGRTETIAQGFAWLILVSVLLNADDPLNALATAINAGTTPGQTATKNTVTY